MYCKLLQNNFAKQEKDFGTNTLEAMLRKNRVCTRNPFFKGTHTLWGNYELRVDGKLLHILETPEYCDVIKVHQYSAIMESARDFVLLYFDDVTLFWSLQDIE